MLVEEVFLRQIGTAIQYTGTPQTWDAIRGCLTDAEVFWLLARNPNVPRPLQEVLASHAAEAEATAEGALIWIRTVALVKLYRENPKFQTKRDAFWSITAPISHGPGASSSRGA